MAKEIPLTRGFVTIVDDEDFEWASQFSWTAVKGRKDCYYAGRVAKVIRPDGTFRHTGRQMQRDLLDPEMKLARSVLVDHRDKDTLNNQRHNLRLVDYSLSNRNRSLFKNNTTGYRWVQYRSDQNQFFFQIKARGRVHRAGRMFSDPHSAAEAANELAVKLFGEDAKPMLNLIRRPNAG
jgi:hypothetical protein